MKKVPLDGSSPSFFAAYAYEKKKGAGRLLLYMYYCSVMPEICIIIASKSKAPPAKKRNL